MVKDLSESISLTRESDTGKKKKKVINNHCLNSSGVSSWYVVLMVVP